MPVQLATLLYHEVCDRPADSGFQRASALPYKHTRAAFARHLDAIAAVVPGSVAVSAIDLTAPGSHLLLTFDDGGASALYIADQLERRGWIGHFFITTSRVNSPGFLTIAGIRRLARAGHMVGSHSHTHPDIFRDLRREAMDEEWRVSRDRLEQILGHSCPAASVPGGDISPQVLESAAGQGFRYIFTSEPHLEPRSLPINSGRAWILGRASIKNSTSAAHAARLAAGRRWTEERALRRARVILSRALAPLYRRYVGRRTLEHPHAA